jgi:hypothetical protein
MLFLMKSSWDRHHGAMAMNVHICIPKRRIDRKDHVGSGPARFIECERPVAVPGSLLVKSKGDLLRTLSEPLFRDKKGVPKTVLPSTV